MKHHATKDRDCQRHIEDLPANVMEEFMWRQPWSVFRMPSYVVRPVSPIFEQRRAKREAAKLARKLATCTGCE